MIKVLSALLLAAVSSLAAAALGDGFRVQSYSPQGQITYAWDTNGGDMSTVYTIRRNGTIVKRSTGVANPYDGPIYYGESFTATLQINDGPQAA